MSPTRWLQQQLALWCIRRPSRLHVERYSLSNTANQAAATKQPDELIRLGTKIKTTTYEWLRHGYIMWFPSAKPGKFKKPIRKGHMASMRDLKLHHIKSRKSETAASKSSAEIEVAPRRDKNDTLVRQRNKGDEDIPLHKNKDVKIFLKTNEVHERIPPEKTKDEVKSPTGITQWRIIISPKSSSVITEFHHKSQIEKFINHQ